MSANIIDEVVDCMPTSSGDINIQKVQTEHRLKLADFWGIKKGFKVLEIGCGQGDTTAVLAFLVGEKGIVHGIDIASPDYGSPLTLGESINYLKKSHIGNRIKIDFDMDILSPSIEFPENYFDSIILSHSSWYLKSAEELHDILKKLRRWGNKLCFAEWDSGIKSVEQYPHFLSVLIQAQYECFKTSSLSNVRTLFTPQDIRKIAESAGWDITAEKSINSPELQDGKWEIEQVLANFHEELKTVENMPAKMATLIKSQINLLESAIITTAIKPMSTYTFTAE
ncbi:class I SAM-dependent methyltransferase [Paenisporosarcina sp. OV554]|uniref:class I SAM-dependent methyltransferase n=1 Tax=Paenisporosarcina sp. OV554 TaxID=2135694 RepID=UPI000D38AED8|nr:class I SAM-dependent methyltransferase [Paenisporosarcina sp. OV554]PUB11150.1 protein-L-isoaspartate(D-aspartate) O-methyltransferase (PCMT) [Paenisporosarcina sp. OV554]